MHIPTYLVYCPGCNYERTICQCLSVKEWQLTVGFYAGIKHFWYQEKQRLIQSIKWRIKEFQHG